MKRRDFIKRSVPVAAVLPAIVDGYSVKAFTGNSPLLKALMDPAIDTDHVLVIVQLSGGNDGLNVVIPISNYSNYFNARSNIAIPQNRILPLTGISQTGLHPSMTGLQSLYNSGKLSIVQAVGYPSPNFSHFRATDIWMSASDSTVEVTNGWGGRYLNTEYPNYPSGYPNSTMPDPLAIQIGSITSLTFQGPTVNMGMSITDPTSFYNLVNNVQDTAPNTPAGNELTYIRTVASQTNQYTLRIRDASNTVTQQGVYPANNSLADQLKIVAKLVKGGLKTRMYMVNFGGFDTHSLQTNTDTTTGNHANLLQKVSDAIKAFVDDCSFLGIQDRVVGMTFSEFGRRIKSNSSLGTDHGAAAPLFLFGNAVIPGVLGNNPTIPANATVNDNIPFQYDLRSIYASILQKWFCVQPTIIQTILFNNFQSLNIVNDTYCRTTGTGDPNQGAGEEFISNYPNPFTESTTIKFKTRGGHTLIQVIDMLGRVVRTPVDRDYAPGTYTTSFDSSGLPTGVYYARFQNGPSQQVKSMLKVR